MNDCFRPIADITVRRRVVSFRPKSGLLDSLVFEPLCQVSLAAVLADPVLHRQDDTMKAFMLALLLGTAIPSMVSPVKAASASAAGYGHVPTGKWVVDYENDFCSLDRDYGDTQNPLALAISPNVMGGNYGVSIVRKPKPLDAKLPTSATIDITIGSIKAKTEISSIEVGPPILRKSTFTLNDELVPALLDSEEMTIGQKTGAQDSFSMPGIDAALKALEKCRVDLVTGWGIPASQQARLKTKAKLIEKSYIGLFMVNDYPEDALRQNMQGLVKSRMLIDDAGRVAQCVVTTSSGSTSLDQATCAVLRARSHHVPAMDIDGKPMPSFTTSKVLWLIPER